MPITRSAPISRALRCAMSPTPPHPQTATVSPGWMLQKSAPMYPVGTASDRNSACSSPIPSGTLKQLTAACGTRMYSACDPA